MVELDRGLAALKVNGLGDLCKRGDEFVAPDAELVGEAFSPWCYGSYLGNDEAGTSFGAAGQVLHQAFINRVVRVGVCRTHGRHDGAVLEGHAADSDGRKQMIIF